MSNNILNKINGITNFSTGFYFIIGKLLSNHVETFPFVHHVILSVRMRSGCLFISVLWNGGIKMDVYERTNFKHPKSQAWDRQRQGAFISPPGSESHSRHGPETLSVSDILLYSSVSLTVSFFLE